MVFPAVTTKLFSSQASSSFSFFPCFKQICENAISTLLFFALPPSLIAPDIGRSQSARRSCEPCARVPKSWTQNDRDSSSSSSSSAVEAELLEWARAQRREQCRRMTTTMPTTTMRVKTARSITALVATAAVARRTFTACLRTLANVIWCRAHTRR